MAHMGGLPVIDLSQIVSKLVEFAPAVAILIYLNWRADRALSAVLQWCLGELSDDDKRERLDNP